nr:MAG TPA: hypothetical protein [Caudoviricetes sp.]
MISDPTFSWGFLVSTPRFRGVFCFWSVRFGRPC